ncbi:MAG: D-alanyl-D-alanine carboxypeptidase family protein [Lachnospiraceae bacterium]
MKRLFFILLSSMILLQSIPVHATIDYAAEAEIRKSLPIETNSIDNWPAGPIVSAKSAILMEANTGTILYAKNIHEELFPASITKLLTTYIASIHSNMNDLVTFSSDAVHSINWREDANMGIDVGSSITMEQALYGVMVGSANEAAYAVAEHISGSVEEFAKLMNNTAKDLGCLNSNFVTPNGIHDVNHYTSAYDMALIAKAYFSNDLLAKMSNTLYYEVPTTELQPKENMIVSAKSKLLSGKQYAYDGLLGTKTGYTSDAKQTLVSAAQRNGMTLICVVLMEDTPCQFTDTVSLFDYGFQNFTSYKISKEDTPYSINNSFLFSSTTPFLGNSNSILSINSDDYIVLPNTITLEDATSQIKYDNLKENEIAIIEYTYQDISMGNISIELDQSELNAFEFGNSVELNNTTPPSEDTENTVYINVKRILIVIIILSCLVISGFFLFSYIKIRRIRKRRQRNLSRRRTRTTRFPFNEF